MEPSPAAARPSLPPIQFLESDKFRREEVDYQNRHTEVPASTMTSATATPAPFPQGPPPPYTASQASYHPALSKTNGQFTEVNSNPQEVVQREPKHSLPSLSEALGVERNPPYSSEGGAPITQTAQPRQVPHSVGSPRRSSGNPSPQHAPQTFGPQHASYPANEQAPTRYVPGESNDYRRRDYPEQHPQVYQQHRSPIMTSQQGRQPVPGPDGSRPFETSPVGPVSNSQFAFGYTQPPSSFSSTAPARPPMTAPPYQTPMGPPAAEPTQGWRPGPPAPPSRPPQIYSDSVKRHLDLYDFEMALNEIAEHSTITLDFSKSYGARLHHIQRSGVVPGTLPAITEVEDLMNKSRQTLEALGRLRETLVAQQAAYFQQAQEHHNRLDQDSKRNDSVMQQDDSKVGGFAGSEPKKRRGRNAAPGRCHSCNRAETPEWRRGPDGARTLCNACGLHYAKLTRKAGATKAAMVGSSLRPKGKEDGNEM
ncbi:hypothetical protein K461DRAFT_292584 [Myriangium duriaei CBS 260.36]|uniref:GATA-type domain-containing protein n=1 Tax=Myriangium duriaei CBS 260.36 TaxID=1168546 RepID=A0A9P4MI43_9PEZI|nr:hypothetical protein K461DRAFT_292584 [Myriangium duriaei CBS 260.36]